MSRVIYLSHAVILDREYAKLVQHREWMLEEYPDIESDSLTLGDAFKNCAILYLNGHEYEAVESDD